MAALFVVVETSAMDAFLRSFRGRGAVHNPQRLALPTVLVPQLHIALVIAALMSFRRTGFVNQSFSPISHSFVLGHAVFLVRAMIGKLSNV